MTEPHDHSDPPTYFSVCSGIGGLDLALERVTGARPVGYCERESYAQAVLMARMEDEALGAAPFWDDLRAVPGGRLRGVVDWLIGGIPCQPHSSAGKQRRGDDERDLIDAFCELAGEMAPRFVFVENVRGFVCGDGLGRLLGQVADLGFDAEWCCVRASDVGAPHQRQRVFVLAYRSGEGLQGLKPDRSPRQDEQRAGRGGRAEVADADCGIARRRGEPRELLGAKELSREQGREPDTRRSPVDSSGKDVADADSRGFRIVASGELHDRLGSAQGHHADRRDGGLAWPPGPSGDWRGIPEHLWPSLEPDLRGMADGLSELVERAMRYRADRLRCLGNAVVPQQAELALRILLQRLTSCDA